MNWKNKTTERFIAFFDILGFKDMVLKSEHSEILKKLELLKNHTRELENKTWDKETLEKANINLDSNNTKSVTFSDSIIFFSKGNTKEDFFKILIDSYSTLKLALENGIAIKGAISFGQVTVDFDNNLFFGQAIIDAYLLHEDLHMLEVILDHNCENQIKTFGNSAINNNIKFDKVKMKYGSINHTIIVDPSIAEDRIDILSKLYDTTSGRPRFYIDNSIEYYNKLKLKSKS